MPNPKPNVVEMLKQQIAERRERALDGALRLVEESLLHDDKERLGLAWEGSQWGPVYDPKYEPWEIVDAIATWLHEKCDAALAQSPAPEPSREEKCWICGKLKGQPPERCPGHYDMSHLEPSREEGEKEVDKEGSMMFRYPHMCRDGHDQIGHMDSEHEQCPLCRAFQALRDSAGMLDEACEVFEMVGGTLPFGADLPKWRAQAQRNRELAGEPVAK